MRCFFFLLFVFCLVPCLTLPKREGLGKGWWCLDSDLRTSKESRGHPCFLFFVGDFEEEQLETKAEFWRPKNGAEQGLFGNTWAMNLRGSGSTNQPNRLPDENPESAKVQFVGVQSLGSHGSPNFSSILKPNPLVIAAQIEGGGVDLEPLEPEGRQRDLNPSGIRMRGRGPLPWCSFWASQKSHGPNICEH